MNENINLCEILKGHEGETFYSPIFGNLTLFAINFQILEFTSIENDTVAIESSGKFYNKADEICVFPSKDQRDWNKWFEEQKPKTPKTWSELVKENKYQPYFAEIHIRFSSKDKCTYGKNPIEKSALALLKIHQIIEVGYGGNVTNEEWLDRYTNDTTKWVIISNDDNGDFIIIETKFNHFRNNPAFHTEEQAKEFLKYPENVQLLKDYFMI